MNQIKFTKANVNHKDIIFSWLEEPHVKEFWDSSQAHKDDIVNFIGGRKSLSSYFDGIFTYWVGSLHDQFYCLILTAEVVEHYSPSKLWRDNVSKDKKTYSIDFCIGNSNFLGKGIASQTLDQFMNFFLSENNCKAAKFFIDPEERNLKAIHVFKKAGFKKVGCFTGENQYWYQGGKKSFLLMTKDFLTLENFVIDKALEKDVSDMNKLSYFKRRNYEKAHPQFWKYAGSKGEEIQRDWFTELIKDEKHIILVAKQKELFLGFIIVKLVPAPEVYNPGGLTCMIDDFCVKEEYMWDEIGGALIDQARKISKSKGASQILVVSGNHDMKKKKFLKKAGLNIASDWYVGAI